MDKVIVFIDGSNFFHACQKAKIRNVDFLKFSKKLSGENRKLVRVYYYNAAVSSDGSDSKEEIVKNQQRFFEALRKQDYMEVRLGRLEKRSRSCKNCEEDFVTWVEKATDINIATDLLVMGYNKAFDTAILISGDGDFSGAIQGAKAGGCNVEVAFFSDGGSHELQKAADHLHRLDEFDFSDCKLDGKK